MGVPMVVVGRRALKAQGGDRPMSTELQRLLHQLKSGKKNIHLASVHDCRSRAADDNEAERCRGLKADDPAPAVPGRGEPTPYDRDPKDPAERRRYRCRGATGPSGTEDLQPANFEVKLQRGHYGRTGCRFGLAVDRISMVFGAGPGHHSGAGTHGQHQLLGSSNDVLFGGVERTRNRSGRIKLGGENQARGKKGPPRASLPLQVGTSRVVLVSF